MGPGEAGLTPGTVLPTPPVAPNAALASAAGFRAGEMADYDYFAHQSPITGDWPNRVARDHGYPLPAFWPNEANNIESIQFGNATAGAALWTFIDSPGHRSTCWGRAGTPATARSASAHDSTSGSGAS